MQKKNSLQVRGSSSRRPGAAEPSTRHVILKAAGPGPGPTHQITAWTGSCRDEGMGGAEWSAIRSEAILGARPGFVQVGGVRLSQVLPGDSSGWAFLRPQPGPKSDRLIRSLPPGAPCSVRHFPHAKTCCASHPDASGPGPGRKPFGPESQSVIWLGVRGRIPSRSRLSDFGP